MPRREMSKRTVYRLQTKSHTFHLYVQFDLANITKWSNEDFTQAFLPGHVTAPFLKTFRAP